MKCLVYGVGEVSCPASKNVPIAMARAKTINKNAVNFVENKKLAPFFNIATLFVDHKFIYYYYKLSYKEPSIYIVYN